MGWAPDGSQRLFLSVKGGPVRIVENGVLLPTPFATISPVFTNSECGVIGLAFDPNFINNRYVYFFVTVSASEQQIIRYTANGNVGASKTTIVPDLPTAGAQSRRRRHRASGRTASSTGRSATTATAPASMRT